MPRFVILLHETPPGSARATHYDLMFEQGQGLRTWAVDQLPETNGECLAQELIEHRLAYLDYEGPVSNQRGEVRRWDRGEYRLLDESPGRWAVEIQGQRLSGMLTLVREQLSAWRLSILLASA